MASHPRYEIVNTIGAGDFATVYRARDRALGREVAVKQIHPQFLNDPRQLARFWQEAQLLATLQHPNILTIYDLDRPRGWLILELMQGSLKHFAQGEPMDLDFLRLSLACALSALQFLHGNGIVHGDVKPGNMLVDPQCRVKLADFGLARRAATEGGSLLKGTTQYMAPELMSNQFGAVGPASDLYSLGFSAYNLMCGAQFENLFPGLASFGRDRQIAWMMWHAAPDRQLPEINRVLQGVPDDLVKVIQRLVVKDQARRYHSAEEALADLRAARLGIEPPPRPPVVDNAPQIRRRKLTIAISAFVCSVLLCVAMIFLLPQPQKPLRPKPPQAARGIIREVLAEEQRFVVESLDDNKRKEVSLRSKDRIFINGKETTVFRDLQPGDRVSVRTFRDDVRGTITEVMAARPETRKGTVTAVKLDEGRVTFTVGEGEDQGKSRQVHVPATVKIGYNGRGTIELADVKPNDRVTIADVTEDTGPVATEMSVARQETLSGVVRDVDPAQRSVKFEVVKNGRPDFVGLPYAADCVVTINGRKLMGQQVVKPTDLKPGDTADRVAYDTQVRSIDVTRIEGQAGTLQKIDYVTRVIDVAVEGSDKPLSYHVGAECKILLTGDVVQLDDLRTGDAVDVAIDATEARPPEAKSITVRRPANPARFAICIGIQQYDDPSLAPLRTPEADAKLVYDMLTRRYALPPEQAELLVNDSRVRLEQAISGVLGRAKAENAVVIYFAGHACKADDDVTYLAPKDFNAKDPAATGLSLQWLADQFEQCPAKQKLLLLDCSQPGNALEVKREPSTADMVRSIKGPPGYAPLRTITVLASCKAAQRGGVLADHSLFAAAVAQGYTGRADKNRDNTIDPSELFSFVGQTMSTLGAPAGLTQSPELFVPDDRPPRLNEEAKREIRKMAALLRQDRLDANRAKDAFDAVEKIVSGQPEPKLLYGLLLLRARDKREARKVFEESEGEFAEHPMPPLVMAFLNYDKLTYTAGVGELANMVRRFPKPQDAGGAYPDLVRRLLVLAGQLREYAATAAAEERRISGPAGERLDAEVAACGEAAVAAYNEGREKIRSVVAEFDRKINGNNDEVTVAKARMERKMLPKYVVFPFDDVVQYILQTLDQ